MEEITLIRAPVTFHNRMFPKYGMVQLLKILNDPRNQYDSDRQFHFEIAFGGKGKQEVVMTGIKKKSKVG